MNMNRVKTLLVGTLLAGTGLFGPRPAGGQTAAPPLIEPPRPEVRHGQFSRRAEWLRATEDQRVLLAEQIGEEGADVWAQRQGWRPLLDGSKDLFPHGPDRVWRGVDGRIHVVEAKGGTSRLGCGYGYKQGTPEWAVKSAERMLKSNGTTACERSAARAILEAAVKAELDVHVVRTAHVLGEPAPPVLDISMNCTAKATRLAQGVLDDLAKAATTSVDDAARTAEKVTQSADDVTRAGESAVAEAGAASKILRPLARAAVPIAVGLDTGLRVTKGVEIERRFEAGAITVHEREIEHARNASGMAGGWGGAFVGAKLGAMGGGAAGTAVAPGPGTAIGGVAGGIAGGIGGYIGGEAAAEAASEWAVKKVHAAGTTVADAAEGAWNWTTDKADAAWGATKRGAQSAWRWLAE